MTDEPLTSSRPRIFDDPDETSAIGAAKTAIVPILAAHGVARLTIAYDGYGDEGQIDGIAAMDSDGVALDLPVVACPRHDGRFDGGVTKSDATLAEALETLGYEVLADCFSGWENNDGAVGSMTLDVATGTITVEHDWRVMTLDRDERVR